MPIMSLRAFASGTISFGLVSIPVKLYSTGEATAGIHLNMLHKKCGTRLKQQYVCPADYLVLLRPYEQGLVMQQLRYADEVRDFSEVPIGQAEVKEPELKLAVQLVDQIANDSFRPGEYEDEVRKRTRALIEQKVAGQEI